MIRLTASAPGPADAASLASSAGWGTVSRCPAPGTDQRDTIALVEKEEGVES